MARRDVGKLSRKSDSALGRTTDGERAAAIYSLIGTAKRNGIDLESYLRNVLLRIAKHPINRTIGTARIKL